MPKAPTKVLDSVAPALTPAPAKGKGSKETDATMKKGRPVTNVFTKDKKPDPTQAKQEA